MRDATRLHMLNRWSPLRNVIIAAKKEITPRIIHTRCNTLLKCIAPRGYYRLIIPQSIASYKA